MPHFLFGPTDDVTFKDRFLAGPSVEGRWSTFSARALSFVEACGEASREIDALLLWCGNVAIPSWVWSVPIPLIALAPESHLYWHPYRHLLTHCDLVITDAPGADRYQQIAWEHARPGNLHGLDRNSLAEIDQSAGERDIDILFVGDLNPAVQTAWLPWLGRLAAMGDRFKVLIATGVGSAEYRSLLRRSKLAFNFSSHGECNRRALEAAAAGAVLLQEAENLEVATYLAPGTEFVPYTRDDFDSVVTRLLASVHERQGFIERAKERVRSYRFDTLIERCVGIDGPEWPGVCERAAKRTSHPLAFSLAERMWQRVARVSPESDSTLARDLQQANERYSLAFLANSPAEAEPHLASCASRNRVAAVGWASALCDLGRVPEAVEVLRVLLGDLDANPNLTPSERETIPYPPRFDFLRVGWERAGYDHCTDLLAEVQTKLALLKCRAYSILAARTGELTAFQKAAEACPHLPAARAALGCAYARSKQFVPAIEHLRIAVEHDLFDHPAANALIAALHENGETQAAAALCAARLRMARSAPGLISDPVQLPPSASHPAPSVSKPVPIGSRQTRFIDLSAQAFRTRFGSSDSPAALSDWTPPEDTRAILTLLALQRPRRVLEVGTAFGGMTANLTALTPQDAIVYSIGLVADGGVGSGELQQTVEMPQRSEYAKWLNHFGTGHKAMLITGDSRMYDFQQLAPLDFAYVDGGHDYETARSDSLGVYQALRTGGCLCWHDVPSSVPWVQVEKAIAELCFAEPVYRVVGTQVAFLFKGEGSSVTAHPDASRLSVTWEGEFDAVHSLALINRSVCQELVAHGHDVRVVNRSSSDPREGGIRRSLPALLADRQKVELPPDTVTVRHRWPPDFKGPPGRGAVVLMQPWEFGRLPRAWIEPILTTVDEIWAYSRSIIRTYIASGIPEERITLIPPGVALKTFRPDLVPLPLPSNKKTKLLFVGGTIARKGFDCLLSAYRQAFTRQDDVCLVVKEMGAKSFYRGQTADASIAAFRADSQSPELLYLTEELTEDDLSRLFAACQVLVHPYRGEGFALPVLEAMACGKPVIVTAGGPTDEFVPPSAGWRIPATVTYFAEEKVGDLITMGKPWWLEPDVSSLAGMLRNVVEDQREVEKRGLAARQAAEGWSWTRSAAIVEDRLRSLRTRTPVRLRRSANTRVLQPAGPAQDENTSSFTVVSEAGTLFPAQVRGRPRVSLTMIVKNEEHNLGDCLASVRDLVDEAVVVDTGSTDRTRDIARSFGAVMGEFPWIDDFAAARNAALDHASGDYAFWMDADDRLDEDNRVKLRALFSSLTGGNDAYVVKCLCVGERPQAGGTTVDHVRIFRRSPAHRWTYRIHEQILPSLRTTGARVAFSGVTIHHVGYIDPDVRRRKLDRDIRLLKLDAAEHPSDPFTLFNLGSVYNELGDYVEAIAALELSLAGSHPKDSIVRKLYALLIQCHLKSGNRTKAIEVCENGRGYYPDDAELVFLAAGLAKECGDLTEAEKLYRKLMTGKEGDHFASVDSTLRTVKGPHNLAVMLMDQNRMSETEGLWREVLLVDPYFLMAHVGLGDLYLRTKNSFGISRQLGALRFLGPDGTVEAAILDARWRSSQGDYAGGVAVLKETARQFPRSVALFVALSHIRLADGSPPEVLEASLRAILDLDPKNFQARHNLEVLYRNTGRWKEGILDGLEAGGPARSPDL